MLYGICKTNEYNPKQVLRQRKYIHISIFAEPIKNKVLTTNC